MAVTRDGDVWSWGSGEGGRLGHGDTADREQPAPVLALKGRNIIRVAAGPTYSAAVASSGEVYTWGLGPLGHGELSHVPKQVRHLIFYFLT